MVGMDAQGRGGCTGSGWMIRSGRLHMVDVGCSSRGGGTGSWWMQSRGGRTGSG